MEPNGLSLKATQWLLWKLITAPEGVEKALNDYHDETLTAFPICGDDRLSNVEHLDIYANMYFFRILDSLKEDFPAVLRIVGDNRFHNLITDYLLQHPPSHWSLRYAGQHLSRFLKTHSLIRKWPCLSDLARFEWLLLEAFDAADREVLTVEQLSSLQANQWSAIRFEPVPSFHLVKFQWQVDRLREQALRGGRLSSARRKKTSLIIWRKDLKVFYRSMESLEEKLLRRLSRKAAFAELCSSAAREIGVEEASTRVTQYLRKWIDERFFVASIRQ